MTFGTANIRSSGLPVPVVAVIGPTASGKSALALALARKMGAEILCVDSMTVYRHMDIGTAKPPAVERGEVVHHGLDVVGPDELFTVARFVEIADGVIADCAARGKPLIAAGGTPLYFKSVFEGLFEGPAADEAFREAAMRRPATELHAELTRVDPMAAGRFHANDLRRVVRALEVYHKTGVPISQQQTQWNAEPRHRAKWVGVKWEKEDLNRRINARTRGMMDAGWLAETRGLLERYGALSLTAQEAAGYEWLGRHLRGEVALDEAIEQIKIATRQLARRQTKWFRRFERVEWVEGPAVAEDVAAVAEKICSELA